MPQIKVSVLIPVFNNLEYTKKCLLNLFEKGLDNREVSKHLDLKIVVINDGSTDGTKEWINENYPSVILLNEPGNLWWSGSINKGIEYSLSDLNPEYIIFWNNDIEIDNDYFLNLAEILRNNEQNTIIGSKIYVKGNDDLVWAIGGKVDIKKGKTYMIGYMAKDNIKLQVPQDSDWLTGMGSIYPSNVFKKIGLINKADFPQYFGDIDISYRAKLAGFSILAFPNLKIWNDIDNTGIKHKGDLKSLRQSFTSIKSLYNLKTDLKFYSKYIGNIQGYFNLFKKYSKYILGFVKAKLKFWTNNN